MEVKEAVERLFLKNKKKGPILRKTLVPDVVTIDYIQDEQGQFGATQADSRIVMEFLEPVKYLKVIFSIVAAQKTAKVKLLFTTDKDSLKINSEISAFADGTYTGQYLSFTEPVRYVTLVAEAKDFYFTIQHLEFIRVLGNEEFCVRTRNQVTRMVRLIRDNPQLIRKFLVTTRQFGIRSALHKAFAVGGRSDQSYQEWIRRYDTITPLDRLEMQKQLESFHYKPLLSVVMPVYNPQPEYFKQAIESVLSQTYPHWELCIADDASPNPVIQEIIRSYCDQDSRIKAVYRQLNGHIAVASNSALEIAAGEFVVLMDHDDLLPPHALYMVAHAISEQGNALDLLYTDEDKINIAGERYDPYFKTDWNASLFEVQNFIAHLGVYRLSIVREIGGFRQGFEGSQDYDLALRFLIQTTPERILHIPHVLYHWRIFQGNHTFSTDNHHISDDSAYKALTEYFASQNRTIQIHPNLTFPGCWRITGSLAATLPLVSLIIPTRDRVGILKKCVDGLLHHTDYSNLEILIVDNDSTKLQTLAYFKAIATNDKVRVIRVSGTFNYSHLNNVAVEAAHGQYIGFINNDIEVIHPEWLQEMVYQVQQSDVGAVGAKLYYRNDTIQHAGVTVGIYGVASHACRHQSRNAVGYFGQLQLVHNVSAVTGACLIMPRSVFQEIGGFDESNLAVSYNDVDLCLKIRAHGYHIVFTPFAQLYHLESVSRGQDMTSEQRERYYRERHVMLQRYGQLLQHDPFYSPNLSLENENMELAFPPRVIRPWRKWTEFVCPFHRGDVLLAIQVAEHAKQQGRFIRLHVSDRLLSWVQDFAPSYEVQSIPIAIPSAAATYVKFREACNYVERRTDFSRAIAGSHPKQNFDQLGLNIVENMLNELELPIDATMKRIVPIHDEAAYCKAEEIFSKFSRPVLLLQPSGGWRLKSLPKSLIVTLTSLAKQQGFLVIQIGGKSDEKILECDGWILENYSPKQWRPIFEKARALIGVDSWSAHFATIMDVAQVTFYGSTQARDVNTRRFFTDQTSESLIFPTQAECSPCHSLVCKYKQEYCQGYAFEAAAFIHFLTDSQNS